MAKSRIVWHGRSVGRCPYRSPAADLTEAFTVTLVGDRRCDRMNRILSVVRSMTDKIIELSRAVVTAPAYGESNGGLESVRSTYC